MGELNELALFAGAGGGILGGKLLGWRTVCAVEIEDYPRRVLMQRQNDGILEPFPIWDDVTTFDGKPWRGIVDVVSGGFPCQDISCAGKGAGIEGSRSGLWSEMARIISEVRPRYVFVENSPLLVSRGLTRVIGDLAKMGYDAKWGVIGGHATGSCSNGQRTWIYAFEADLKHHPAHHANEELNKKESRRRQFARAIGACASESEHSAVLRDPDALAIELGELKAIGNGQDPIVAATAWEILTNEQ